MLPVSLPRMCAQEMKIAGAVHASSRGLPALGSYRRRDIDGNGGFWIGKNKLTDVTTTKPTTKNRRLSILALASSSPFGETGNSPRENLYLEVLKAARAKFIKEVSFESNDKDISLAKALLYIAAEDEAFMALNQEIDACSFQNEWKDASLPTDAHEWDSIDSMPLAGKNISEWLAELDTIAREVEAELVPRDIEFHLMEVLDAVNLVIFGSRGFKSYLPLDSKCVYLHSAFNSSCFSEILLTIIYIEVCRRLNVTILGSGDGEDFLVWPQTGYPEELFKSTNVNSLFKVVNVEVPGSKTSNMNTDSLAGLNIATNRDFTGMALANLIELHWHCASRSNRGLTLTSPLSFFHQTDDTCRNFDVAFPTLRPQELRLAIMASERLLILQPGNWARRRDLGMMLYYTRDYWEAIRELSICLAFAPQEEGEIIGPFIDKLHLLRLEESWKTSRGDN